MTSYAEAERLASSPPFRRLVLYAQTSGDLHSREWRARDSLKLGKTEVAASMMLAATPELSQGDARCPGAHWRLLADERTRVTALIAALDAGGDSDTLAGLVPVYNQAGRQGDWYDPAIGLRHRPPPDMLADDLGLLRRRARPACLEALWPGYHVLRREWRQRKEAKVEQEEWSREWLGRRRGQAGYGPIADREDENAPGVDEIVAGDGADVTGRGRKRVWYVGGENSRDHDAAISKLDRQAFIASLSPDDAKLVGLKMLGLSSVELGAAFGISAGAARVRLSRIANGEHISNVACNTVPNFGRYLLQKQIARCEYQPSPRYTKTRGLRFQLEPGEADRRIRLQRLRQPVDAFRQVDIDDLPPWAVRVYRPAASLISQLPLAA
jgi:hypothetical protein